MVVGGNGFGAVIQGMTAEYGDGEMLLLQSLSIEKVEIIVGDVIEGIAVDSRIHHPFGVGRQVEGLAGSRIEALDTISQEHHIEHAVCILDNLISGNTLEELAPVTTVEGIVIDTCPHSSGRIETDGRHGRTRKEMLADDAGG